nr:uncharacterized protein LOC111984280 [Quercus suber]
MSVVGSLAEDSNSEPKRARLKIRPSLSFSDEDKIGIIQPYNDALVVTLRIGGYDVKKVMVDQGNCVEIMYLDLYKGLNLKPEDLTAYNAPLVSFDEKVVIPKGQIRLPVQASSEVVEMDFIVVDAYSPYTAIVARPWLHTRSAVSLTLHQKVKLELSDHLKRKKGWWNFWGAYKALGVDPIFICHHLNVNPSIIPSKQPPRCSSKEYSNAVKDEMMKLKQARAIKEIDQLVDATVGHPRMSFLDAFQRYHQIPLALVNQERIAFVTPIGNYHYKVMPFGLKNAGATYQTMMTRMFEPQLAKNVEIYIDDIVVKSKVESEHVNDLKNIFAILRKHML